MAEQLLKTHPRAVRWTMLSFAAFFGCFNFPICTEYLSLDFLRFYILTAACGAVGGGLALVYGAGHCKRVWAEVLFFTLVGLACRYLLEFGEVSNTYNFTPGKVASFLVLIPIGTAVAYHLVAQRKREEQ